MPGGSKPSLTAERQLRTREEGREMTGNTKDSGI